MNNKKLKVELAKLIDEIDDCEAEMELSGGSFIPAYVYLSVSYPVLKELRAKGLVTFNMEYLNTGGAIDYVSVTPKGYTYIEDEKSERNKWLIRTVIIGAASSFITSVITSLTINLLLLR